MAKISISDVVFYEERKVTDANMGKINMSDVSFYKEWIVTYADLLGIHELYLF